MVKKIEDLNFYELLEVSPKASSQEIHRAYDRVRRIYEPNSIALYSLFTPEETAVIHRRIEDAYRTLVYETNRRKYDELLRSMGQLSESVPATPPRYQPPQEQPRPAQEANRNSNTALQQPAPASPAPVPAQPFTGEFTGQAIKLLREQRNLTIRQVSDITKIGSRYVELIEAEEYEKLPARPYLRGFLVLYAKVLGYEPERLASDYLKRCEAAKAK